MGQARTPQVSGNTEGTLIMKTNPVKLFHRFYIEYTDQHGRVLVADKPLPKHRIPHLVSSLLRKNNTVTVRKEVGQFSGMVLVPVFVEKRSSP